MTRSTVIRGQHLYVVEFGPFTIGSLLPLTAEQLEAGDAVDDLWERVGLVIDARDFGNDYHRVRRQILAYMALETSATGTSWRVTPATIALRIYLDDQPRWIDLRAALS